MLNLRYHRAFIEASNEYLKDFIKQDELLVNVIDYFTEKYNKKRSDGTEGQMKYFHVSKELLNKKKEIENKKQLFEYSDINAQLQFKSLYLEKPLLKN